MWSPAGSVSRARRRRPYSVIDTSTTQRLSAERQRETRLPCSKRTSNRVTSGVLSTSRLAIELHVKGFGYEPRRMRSTLHCSRVTPCSATISSNELFSHNSVAVTIRSASYYPGEANDPWLISYRASRYVHVANWRLVGVEVLCGSV